MLWCGLQVKRQILKLIRMNQKQEVPLWLKVSFRIMYGVDDWAERVRWLPILCRFSEVAVIMYFQIVKTFIDLMVYLLKETVPYTDLTYQLFVLTGASFLLTLPLFAYEYVHYNELGAVEERKTLSKVIHACLIFMLYLNYVLYYMVGYYLWRKITSLNQSITFLFDLLVVVTLSLMYIFQTVLFTSRRLLGWLSPFLPPLFIYLSTKIRAFAMLAIAIPMLYKQKKFDIVLDLKLIIVTSLWSIIALFETVFSELLLWITLILLVIFTTAHHFLTSRPIENLSTMEQIEMMLEIYQAQAQKESNQEEAEVFSFNQEEAYLYQKYLNEVDLSKVERARVASEIQFTQWNELKKEVLWQRILQEKNENPSLHINLIVFSAGFMFKQNQLGCLYDLQKLYIQNQKKGIRTVYGIYRAAQNVLLRQQKNEDSQQNNVRIADFISAETAYSQFYQILDSLLTKLVQFWKEIDENDSVITEKIQEIFICVLCYHEKLSQNIANLKTFKINKEIALFEVVSGIVNCYSMNRSVPEQFDSSELREVSFQYLYIKNTKITKISLKLLKDLNYQLEDIIHEKLQSFLPHNFIRYLEQSCQLFLANQEESAIMLPLMSRNGCFIMKRCRIHLVMEETTPSFVLIMERWENNVPLLLLNLNKQTVEGINNQLREYAEIQIEVLQQFFQKSNYLLFNSVFGTELTQKEQESLSRGQKLKTKFSSSYELRPKKKRGAYNQEEVDLHLEQSLTVGLQKWLVLKLTSSVGSLDFTVFQKEDEVKTGKDNTHREMTLQQKYANQTFFCPIQNPFKPKIVEKLSHDQKMAVKSYCCFLSILNAASFVLFAIFIMMDIILDSSNYQQIIDIRDLNNEYLCLLRMYSNSYSHNFFTRDPNSTLAYLNSVLYNNSADAATLDGVYTSLNQYYLDQKQKNIKEFTSTYLLQKNVQGYTPMNYNLTFATYQIKTNTLYSTFYDFISFPEGVGESNIDFLVANYPNLIHVFPAYQEHHNEQIYFNASQAYLQILIKIALISIGTIIAVSLFLSGQVVRTEQEIKKVYSFVEHRDIHEVLEKLDGLKTNIGQICVREEKISERNSYHQISTSFRQAMGEEIKPPPSSSLGIHPQQKAPDHEQKDPSVSCGQTFKNFSKLFYFSGLVLIAMFSIIKFQQAKLTTEQITYKSIINLLQKYQTEQMFMQRYYIQLFQGHFYFALTGESYPLESSPIVKIDFNDVNLPDVIQQDIAYHQDLCREEYNSLVNLPAFSQTYEECSTMSAGILSKSFSESRQVYQSNIRELLLLGYENYLSNGTTNKLKQVIYMKRLIASFIRVKVAHFFDNLSVYEKTKKQSEMHLVIIYLIVTLGLMVLLLVYVYSLMKRRTVLGSLVRIVPTSAMYRAPTCTYVRRNNILDKIEVL